MLLSVKLYLPDDVYSAYEKRGPLEKVLAAHLARTVSHTSSKPLYITDDIRRRLDKLFGRNFSTADELVAAIEKLLSVKVADVEIPLQPILLTRLRSRCFGMQFEDFLAAQTVKELEEFAGMR